MRLFFAIPLPDPARDALDTASRAFKDAAPAWRSEKWVPPANLHVTLLFVGEQADERLEALADAGRRASCRVPQFAIELDDIAASPRPRNATMLWATFERGSHQAAGLADAIAEALAPLGVQPPRRPFAAHVTLVRSRRPRQAPADALAAAREALLAAGDPRVVSVTEAILYKSTLTPSGPVYDALASLPLGRD
ncbi:MAG: RNA 2',3'-cyclic phosphodiesterase [Coriobacteriia bacterium]|nr:RNA 2',3'-cyclic phosphodiesterase [Coriobacteriia bacterium]